jgi:hypothetical protein
VTERRQKITFGEMRESGVRGLLLFCSDYRCSHNVTLTPSVVDQWPDDLRLSDLEPRFVCQGLSETWSKYQSGLETSERRALAVANRCPIIDLQLRSSADCAGRADTPRQ